ncbi:MAG: HEPN domain-containing protein [Firmicutes bacterium]|nr:HEPN domain-containing protein [Bacillota bacterium]
MTGGQDAAYRLRMAEGFLEEARQDVELGRWRSAGDNGQPAVENAAKAALALVGPVGRTHNPAVLLRQALVEGRFAPRYIDLVRRLAEKAELLGVDVHDRLRRRGRRADAVGTL